MTEEQSCHPFKAITDTHSADTIGTTFTGGPLTARANSPIPCSSLADLAAFGYVEAMQIIAFPIPRRQP